MGSIVVVAFSDRLCESGFVVSDDIAAKPRPLADNVVDVVRKGLIR